MITQKELKEILHYDPETGMFSWLVSRGNVKKGKITGTPNSRGYLTIWVGKKSYTRHRLAWFYVYGVWPKDQIDHINRIKTDNRISNLREATNAENQKNRNLRKDNKSGFTGVNWDSAEKKWVAQIQINKKKINLGRFDSKEKAINTRKEANEKYGFYES